MGRRPANTEHAKHVANSHLYGFRVNPARLEGRAGQMSTLFNIFFGTFQNFQEINETLKENRWIFLISIHSKLYPVQLFTIQISYSWIISNFKFNLRFFYPWVGSKNKEVVGMA